MLLADFFIKKLNNKALVVTARHMTKMVMSKVI